MSQKIALFPLKTVLLPGCTLDLQLFEARYLDMVSRCFKSGEGFVVVALEKGPEAGTGDLRFSALGCEARIVDFQQRDNGLLGIRVLGARRAQVSQVEVAEDGLVVAQVQWRPEAGDAELVTEHEELEELHAALLQHPLASGLDLPPVGNSQQALAYQLAYLLPFSLDQKTHLLALDEPSERLQQIHEWLEVLQA
ncbi:MAG: LON peptidase substrate-binding domain-containing protein [Halopseudomonas sp.]|uniref:LON peptidase substrate-binding domain-containing protein n=1 Tax=Halopseudomonas sp. TaxID=2901191 RepID=UPI0030034DA5